MTKRYIDTYNQLEVVEVGEVDGIVLLRWKDETDTVAAWSRNSVNYFKETGALIPHPDDGPADEAGSTNEGGG